MKVLQLCHKTPFPPRDGGCIAMNNITQGLLALGYTVKVLSINTPKSSISIDNLPIDYVNNTQIETVFVNTAIQPLHALANIFSQIVRAARRNT